MATPEIKDIIKQQMFKNDETTAAEVEIIYKRKGIIYLLEAVFGGEVI